MTQRRRLWHITGAEMRLPGGKIISVWPVGASYAWTIRDDSAHTWALLADGRGYSFSAAKTASVAKARRLGLL